MFKKILIANRGEIAVRVIRACREMGIQAVAVYSQADKDSLHVRLADQSVCIGPAPASESYLYIPNIISAAEITGADAIHPGYGFLAENTYFADVCQSADIAFIGPSKETIQKMGDKIEARRIMQKAGVAVVPGSDGPVTPDTPDLYKLADKVGYPLVVKAAGGGGGRGMRIVSQKEDLKSSIATCQAEAKAAFSDDKVYIEKYMQAGRHIEIQIVGDRYGNATSFPERDCSIQRRHQKLLEETPSPAVPGRYQRKMGKASRIASKAADYVTAGTVEFLFDPQEKRYYFLEMNTRIQVEHGITEMITGIDLVKEQIRLAAGEKIGYRWRDVEWRGHSIECRINAEDPDKGFTPSCGTLTRVSLPGGLGVRVDTHIFGGYEIGPHYDSLLAKVIVHAENRAAAINRMRRALREFIIEGIQTTLPFHRKVMDDEFFVRGEYDTHFLEKRMKQAV